jgi:hypothetical protein
LKPGDLCKSLNSFKELWAFSGPCVTQTPQPIGVLGKDDLMFVLSTPRFVRKESDEMDEMKEMLVMTRIGIGWVAIHDVGRV